MPSIKVVPAADASRVGYQQVQAAFGPGAAGPLQIVTPAAQAQRSRADRDPRSGHRGADAHADRRGYALITAIPRQDPSNPAVGPTIDRLRAELPAGSLIGGAVAENHDLQAALSAKTPLVIGVDPRPRVLLLLIALQAPLIAAVGVLTNLLATGAAFGVAKWIFQDGALHSLLGFQSQGFLDAWGPVFFFAMIFAISMDYTVFLLSARQGALGRTHDPREAMVGGVAHSGRVIFAAGAVMVAVFFTFALSGPLPPKEMGIILGVAVLLDAALIRLLLLPVLLRLMGTLGLVPAALGAPAAPRRHLRTRMSTGGTEHVTTNVRALADGMVPGLAPGPRAPDRARPHLHRPSGPGRTRCPSELEHATGRRRFRSWSPATR